MGQPCPVKLDDVNLSSGVVETILASQSYLLDCDDVTFFFFSALKNSFFQDFIWKTMKDSC